MTDPKANTITLYFQWNTATPDPRQYNQQRQTLFPGEHKDSTVPLRIAIEIPLTGEFVYNADKILTAQLSSDQNAPEPILTPQGMFLAISLLEKPFAEAEEKEQEKQSESKQKLDDEWASEGWDEDEESSDPWEDEESEPTVDPLPEDSPQPTEEPEGDSWEDAISTDESDSDVPDWADESTWSDEDEKGDE